jgi:hypothetical protein
MTNHILKNEGKALLHLFQKLDQLKELNRIFAQYAEPGIVAHCKIANLQNNCLIVIVDNGNWATQLRFHIPNLIVQMRQHTVLQNLKAICCKTRPDPALVKPQKKRQRSMVRISASTATLIEQSAEGISDTKLRNILERIAKKAR